MIDIDYSGCYANIIHDEMHLSVNNGQISELLNEYINKAMNSYIQNNLYTEPKSEYDTLIFKKITFNKLSMMFVPVDGIKTNRFKFTTDLLNTIERIMIWLEKPVNFEEERKHFIIRDRDNKIDILINKSKGFSK